MMENSLEDLVFLEILAIQEAPVRRKIIKVSHLKCKACRACPTQRIQFAVTPLTLLEIRRNGDICW